MTWQKFPDRFIWQLSFVVTIRWLYFGMGDGAQPDGTGSTEYGDSRGGDGAQSNRCAFYSSQVESRAKG